VIATSTVLRLVLLALAAGLADGCSSSAQNTTVGADGGSANDLSAPSGDLAADPAAVTFAVPTGGGAVDVVGTSQSYAFEFPANVAGQKFTITPIAAAAAGLPAGRFSDIFRLGPDGARFDPPLKVRPQHAPAVGPLIALLYPSSGPPIGAAVFVVDGAYLVRHFSTLAIPVGIIEQACDSGEVIGSPEYDGPSCALNYVSAGGYHVISGNMDTPDSRGSVHTLCVLLDSCIEIQQYCCPPAAVADQIEKDQSFCSSGGEFDWTDVFTTSRDVCGGRQSPVTPPGCDLVRGVFHADNTCRFTKRCGAATETTTITCDGTNCQCGVKNFPQGDGCDGPVAATTSAAYVGCP